MQRKHMAAAFFLMAYDEFTGRLRISEDLLGCGVVGAQLADLILDRRVDIGDGRVVALERGDTGDAVADYVVESVSQQPQTHVVRTWCENLAEPMREMLGRRLAAEGVLRREQRRRGDRYPALDLLRAASPQLRLEHALRTPSADLDLVAGYTAALIWTLGVERILDLNMDRVSARDFVTTIHAALPPSLQDLLRGLQLAVAAVSIRVRR